MTLHGEQCRHLYAALAFPGRGGLGSCTLRSAALALDYTRRLDYVRHAARIDPDEMSAIGPNASRVPFIHCWLEHRDDLLAPTTIERRRRFVVPMTRAAITKLMACATCGQCRAQHSTRSRDASGCARR